MANGLLDFLQGASNAAAANVSAPVDGLTWLLNKLGADIKTPVGGSDWMRERGLTAEPTNKLAGILGESVGGVLPMVTAAKAPQIAQGLLQAEKNLAAPRTLNPQTGAILWHGSPHKFDAFDSSKIGTGEGAQAYGHGLYLAETPEVAGWYRTGGWGGTQHGKTQVLIDGKPYSATTLDSATPHNYAADAFDRFGDKKSAINWLIEGGSPSEVAAAKILKKSKTLENAGVNPGSLYKVDLPDEHIAKMLDWDKPLSKQSPEVQKALGKFDADSYHPSGADYDANELGQQIYNRLAGVLNVRNPNPSSGMVKATDYLQKQGIPGIRYLDGGSRGTGAGTSNYVVFPGNEGLLSILERNGQPIK